ncbi:MAG: glycoside hydrolase [Lentisphaeria bacterium]|nr:glycoside hydrolase [Lentisphaeria bacterium]
MKTNGVICSMPHDKFGYFGWPSIARQADGTLLVAASGFRNQHVCPWGRTVVCKSHDNGVTWSAPIVVNNTPLDDRDAGIISLGGQRLALTWFTSNTIFYYRQFKNPETGWDAARKEMGAVMDTWTDGMINRYIGSWIRVSPDGEYWGEPFQAPVNTPHGFIVLKDGSWFYLGKKWDMDVNGIHTLHKHNTPIQAAISHDEGKNWQLLGTVPLPDGVVNDECHEPHVVELDDGTLLGAVRVHNPFTSMITRSTDGGRTWSVMESIGAAGSPPHLLKHSSGAIVMVYGYRSAPYGERAKVSRDGGQTWTDEIILRDDAPNGDLGYPASVELPNGDILTIYYQQANAGEKTSLLWTRWSL